MYEVGDKVIYQGADKNAYKKVGVLKSIEEKDGKPQLTVEFDNGETFTAPVDDWSREFTNAARNAKDADGNPITVGKYVWIADSSDGVMREVVRIDGHKVYHKPENGGPVSWDLDEDLIVNTRRNAYTSTNSVVRNAMAANRRVARNAEFFDSKEFGSHDVKTEIGDYGKGTGYHISIYTDGLTSSSSWGDKGKKCIAEAKQSLAVMQRKTSALKQAISWMEQNAK